MNMHFFDNVNRVDVGPTSDARGNIQIRLYEALDSGEVIYHEIRITPTGRRKFDLRDQTVISKPEAMEVGS